MISNNDGYELICPSARIESGEDLTTVVDSIRKSQFADQVFCPHCYESLNKLYPVRFRNNTTRRVCFYHPKYESNSQECRNWQGESEKHHSAKDAIKRYFEIHGVADLSVREEFRLKDSDAPTRQPDLMLIYPNGTMKAIEVQISYINSLQLMERTSDIRNHGVSTVSWYLHGKNYNEENRKWCSANNVGCFHLWFENSDNAKPKWKESEPYSEPRKKNDSVSNDLCSSADSLIATIASKSETLATHPIEVGDFVRFLSIAPQHSDLARQQVVEVEGDLARLRHFAFFVPIADLELTEPTEIERKCCDRYNMLAKIYPIKSRSIVRNI